MHRAWLWTIALASSLMVPSIESAHAVMSDAPHDAPNKVANDTMPQDDGQRACWQDGIKATAPGLECGERRHA